MDFKSGEERDAYEEKERDGGREAEGERRRERDVEIDLQKG